MWSFLLTSILRYLSFDGVSFYSICSWLKVTEYQVCPHSHEEWTKSIFVLKTGNFMFKYIVNCTFFVCSLHVSGRPYYFQCQTQANFIAYTNNQPMYEIMSLFLQTPYDKCWCSSNKHIFLAISIKIKSISSLFVLFVCLFVFCVCFMFIFQFWLQCPK